MAANNYGFMHMPEIKRNIYGCRPEERSTIKIQGLDSAAIYMGGFVPFVTGTDAAPSGAEFGIPAFADDSIIGGFVVGFSRRGSLLPIWEDTGKAGTVTDATGELPVKYAFSASNDESNTTSAKNELVEIRPIMAGDIIEVSTWGASTVAVARGTTTAAGTTTSSANIGVAMSVDTTYHFAVTESTAAKTLANLDFMTTCIDGNKPADTKRVYVFPLRSFSQFKSPDA